MSNEKTELYGLVGRRLSHSFSRDFFNRKFESENIDAKYVNFELDNIGELPAIITANPKLKGFNVTIPYKKEVMRFLDDIDTRASRIGAVNVVRVERDGSQTRLIGYNSDVIGFSKSIAPLLNNSHRRALVLGTGGASQAVAEGLRGLGLEFTFVSRTPSAGELGYDELDRQVMSEHTLVVNTTPLGMYPNVDSCPPIPYDLLSPGHLCYDLTYNPENTKFIKECAARGAVTKNGLEMLFLQALESWEMWHRHSK